MGAPGIDLRCWLPFYAQATASARFGVLWMRGLPRLGAMNRTVFAPGFRLSVVDVFVIGGGTAAAIALSMYVWWWGFVPAFVLAHFFLFCNVVRMARSSELVWAGIFIMLAGATIAFNVPGWAATALVSLLVTVAMFVVEMRKPSYHGVGWQRVNPGLPAWWERRVAEKGGG
jgi:hypothetical protein